MNELSKDKTMTTKQLAKLWGISPETIRLNGKILFPNKQTICGKPILWSEQECKLLLEKIRNNQQGSMATSKAALEGITSDITPALMIKQAMELMQKGYELELQRIEADKQKIEKERDELQIQLDDSKEWTSLQRYFDIKGWKADRKKLSAISRKLGEKGYERRKIYSIEYQNGLWSYRISDLDDYFFEPAF